MKLQDSEQDVDVAINNSSSLTNILCILSMLEKAFDRLARQNYNRRNQYPELIIEIESTLAMLRSWIYNYGIFSGTDAFNKAVELWVETVGMLIADLITECTPVKGKKRVKKSRLIYQQENLRKTINKMLNHITYHSL